MDAPGPGTSLVAFEKADPARRIAGLGGDASALFSTLVGSLLTLGSFAFGALGILLQEPFVALGLGLPSLAAGVNLLQAGTQRLKSLEREASGVGVILGRAWVEVTSFHGAPGWKVHHSFRVRRRKGQAITTELRVRVPGGEYLRARLSGYEGRAGEVFMQHVTEPLSSDRVHIEDLWLFLPEGAFERPPDPTRQIVVFELVQYVAESAQLIALRSIRHFLPARRAPTRARPRAPARELYGVIPGSCPFCGDGFFADTVACPSCATPHHRECWVDAGQCTTYACDESGRPVEAPRRS